MSDSTLQADVLLTTAQIREKVAEYHAWGDTIEALEQRREERRQWLKLVTLLVGEDVVGPLIGDIGADDEADGEPRPRKRRGGITYTGFIENYVTRVNRPVGYAELREAVSASALGERFKENDKSFYGAILKLTTKDILKKKNGLLFSPSAFSDYERKVAEGVIDEKVVMAGRPAPLAGEVKRFLDGCPNGATGREVIKHMLASPELAQSVKRSDTGIYNALARLVKKEAIRKIGITYYSPDAAPVENSGSDEDAAA